MASPLAPARGELTVREWQVLDALTRPGSSYKIAADALGMSPNTVRQHVRSILRKADVSTIAQATRRLIEDRQGPFGIAQKGE